MTTHTRILSIVFALALVGACSKTTKDEAPATDDTASTAGAARTATAAAPAPAAAEDDSSCGGAEEAKMDCGASDGECGMPGSSCNQWDEEAMAVTKRKVPDDAVWADWEVEGMHCGGCERRVMAKVGELDGVVAVEANAGTGHVRVAVLKGHEKTHEAIPGRISELGYRVK